ncbi:hypothetical protein MIND_00159500 [Mycena indigotica]|uniref:Uncharacterized protein n=1 Tax=Mycena indigotica TaxID=2126181 RepID=A0A8H6TGQ3_9AGAR|nr:uncharacterized protein MIND_00159500 [Mycena indigotica]KAF7316407.1 hypothetical protein MIND_00159500 [Mycena indigotica]
MSQHNPLASTSTPSTKCPPTPECKFKFDPIELQPLPQTNQARLDWFLKVSSAAVWSPRLPSPHWSRILNRENKGTVDNSEIQGDSDINASIAHSQHILYPNSSVEQRMTARRALVSNATFHAILVRNGVTKSSYSKPLANALEVYFHALAVFDFFLAEMWVIHPVDTYRYVSVRCLLSFYFHPHSSRRRPGSLEKRKWLEDDHEDESRPTQKHCRGLDPVTAIVHYLPQVPAIAPLLRLTTTQEDKKIEAQGKGSKRCKENRPPHRSSWSSRPRSSHEIFRDQLPTLPLSMFFDAAARLPRPALDDLLRLEPLWYNGVMDCGQALSARDLLAVLSLASPTISNADLTLLRNATCDHIRRITRLADLLNVPSLGRSRKLDLAAVYFFIANHERDLPPEQTWLWQVSRPARLMAKAKGQSIPFKTVANGETLGVLRTLRRLGDQGAREMGWIGEPLRITGGLTSSPAPLDSETRAGSDSSFPV